MKNKVMELFSDTYYIGATAKKPYISASEC